MISHEKRIVKFLLTPASYPHKVDKILHYETHVSHVFVAGPYAYKLKKPVKFPFLDASTLSLRGRFCRLELSLNRRLTTKVYLGVVSIKQQDGQLTLGGRGKTVEWLVKMNRLPAELMLDQLISRGRIDQKDIKHIANRLIPFFKKAARGASIQRYGKPSAVAQLVLGNLSECQPFVGKLLPEVDHRYLETAYKQYLTLYEPILKRRFKEKRIIDGHGDLRCENICMTKPVEVFDCVEFQPAFRCGDAANDFSFLVMDLRFRGHHQLADVLIDAYRKSMKDPTFDAVLPFYECHRSLVRGKVRGFAWLQHPRSAEGRRVKNISKRHFKLAVSLAKQFARPRLVVVGGLIGTGKSTLADYLAKVLGATWLRTDEIRLREFANSRRPNKVFGEGIYSSHISDLVYERLIQRTEALLREGKSVVSDGTFSKAIGRKALRQIAQKHGSSFHFFECVSPRALAMKRVKKRYQLKKDISEARPEHYDRLKSGFELINGWDPSLWTRLNTNRSISACNEAALKVLQKAWT